ncbi:MAG: hypothetical protein KDJ86_09170 [Bauldia sp.]|uniref:hypothetical protein n=1 Tax=Bauldia sp. TaxID=2575872 RepID=UPI001D82D233|nr:hypothetical protein [Bauldia sp.]MCB1495942.1 hypothetical protein [Bauldia sp.]
MRCVLHIGAEKTGTTSIQRSLTKNGGLLAARKIHYPELFHGQRHVKISCFAMDNDRLDIRKRRLGLTDDAAIEKFRKGFRRDFAKEMETCRKRTGTVVIVNEHLSRLQNAAEVERLKAFIERFFEAIDIHFYIRRQDLLMRSMYSTVIKVGGIRENVFPPFEEGGRDFLAFDFHRIFRLWTSVFPMESFHIHRFDRSALLSGDVVVDFLSRSGLFEQAAAEAFRIEAENASLDPIALEVLRQFNLAWGQHGYEKAGLRGTGALAGELFPGRGKPVSRAEAETFLSHFEAGNRALARACFDSDELFDTSDIAALPETVDPPRPTAEDTARVLSAIWNLKFSRMSS